MTTIRQQLASPLQLVALASAGLILLPLGYVTSQAVSADPAVWSRLWATRIPELLSNTVSLAASVACLTLVLGVSTAWIVTRLEFPGRRLWEGALVLPLAMPTYVLAYIYSYLLGIRRTCGAPLATDRRTASADFLSPKLSGRDAGHGAGYVSLRLSPEPQCAPQHERLVRRSVPRQRRLPAENALAVTLPLMRPSIAAGLALVILVRRVGFRCGVTTCATKP